MTYEEFIQIGIAKEFIEICGQHSQRLKSLAEIVLQQAFVSGQSDGMNQAQKILRKEQ